MPEPQSVACDESSLRRAGSLHGRLWAWAVKNCIPLGASIEITLVAISAARIATISTALCLIRKNGAGLS